MFLQRIFALSLLAFSSTALADSVDINLRDSSAQFQYGASMGRDTLGRSEIHLGFLYTNNNNTLGEMGLTVKDEVGSSTSGVTVGVGIKALVAKVPNNKGATALAIGGVVRFAPFSDTRFGMGGSVFLSPNIVTFGDAERISETGLKMDYEVIPQAVVYLGYRRIKLGIKFAPDAILDEGAHIGVRISF